MTSDGADRAWSEVYVGGQTSTEDGACASWALGHRKTKTAAST